MARRDRINKALNETYPTLRYIWVCLDKMDYSILPADIKPFIKHVPIVIYFPQDIWNQYLNNVDINKVRIMDVDQLSKYGPRYTETSILA
jgi:hypothetical protein